MTIARKPLCIDLYCGLGGWSAGFLHEGFRCVGFDLEVHDYGQGRYPGELVLQDVRTIHGGQFADADIIVASPPCQMYSWMAMPWSRAKAKARWYREDPARQVELNELFDACFRIQREASDAAGRRIPMIVENVKGAQPWVGRAKWHYGSYYLWGDVPALMPFTLPCHKLAPEISTGIRNGYSPPRWTNPAEWGVAHNTESGTGRNPVNGGGKKRKCEFCGYWFPEDLGRYGCPNCNGEGLNGAGVKQHGSGAAWFDKALDERRRQAGAGLKVPGNKLSQNGFTIPVAREIDKSRKPETFALSTEDRRQHLSFSRKAASAQIAKIPFALSLAVAKWTIARMWESARA